MLFLCVDSSFAHCVYCTGTQEEWKNFIIPEELTAELGHEWPLSSSYTYRLALAATKEERDKLRPTSCPSRAHKRRHPLPTTVFVLEPPEHDDDDDDDDDWGRDLDERLAAGAKGKHECGFKGDTHTASA